MLFENLQELDATAIYTDNLLLQELMEMHSVVHCKSNDMEPNEKKTRLALIIMDQELVGKCIYAYVYIVILHTLCKITPVYTGRNTLK